MQREHGRRAVFTNAAQESDATRVGIADEKAVATPGAERSPQTIAQLQLLPVLGELGVPRERQALWIVRDGGIQVLIDESFQARAVAELRGIRRNSLRMWPRAQRKHGP